MDEKKALSLLEKYGSDSMSYRYVVAHCIAVQKLSMEWAAKIKKNGYDVDIDFVNTASLLHDIGRFSYGAGSQNMIKHGIQGGKILRKEGYPRHAELVERHVGAGITKADVRKQKLPIPEKNYIPKTIEDKIVACADNLIDGSEVITIKEAAKEFEEKLGKPYAERVLKLYKEIEELLKKRKK